MNTQSVSQNGWLVHAVGLASAIMLALQVSAENWVAASGSLTDGANWNNGVAPTNGAWAVIDNAGTALMGSGSLTCTFLYPGYTATGHLIQSGGDIVVTGNADPTFGLGVQEGSVGTYDLSGGSLSQLAGNFQIGGRGTGTFTQTGGVVTGNNWVVVGRYGPAGNGTLTVSGGTFLQSSSGNALIIAEGGTGSLTVTNAGVVNLNGGLRIGMVKNGTGDVGTGTGTVYLCQGGTISTPNVQTLGGSSTFYFDGGVLSARNSGQTYSAFMQGLSAAYVRSGGAVIDTGSNAATINQNLLDGGGAGGLTKLGSGVLMLGGANGYTGNTVVSNGVLAALSPSALPGYSTPGQIKVADGAGLSVGVGTASAWTAEQAYTLAYQASFGTGCSFGFDTTPANTLLDFPIDLSSKGLRLVKTGANVLQLTGVNTNAGTTVCGGVLQADFGTGLSASGNVTLNGGTLSSAGGSITAALGSGAGQINVVSNAPAGFSAYDAPLDVNLGGSGASLQWGSSAFNPSPLLLNETGASAALTFANGLDLAGGARTVAVNATAAGTGATVSGAITDSVGGGGLTKNGAGSLTLTGTGAYTGFTYVNNGALNLAAAGGYSLGEITVTGGGLNVGAAAVTQTTGNFVVHNGSASLEGGSVSDANGQAYIGMWWGTSLLSVNGGSFSVGNELNVGTWAGATGALNLSDGTVSCATLYVGRGGNGTVTQTGGAVVRNNNPSGEWRIGGWEDWSPIAGTGVYNMQGGTLDTVGQNLQIGCSGRGTMNQTGGTVTCGGWPVVGRFYGGTGVYTLSGGTFNQTGTGNKLLIAEHGTGTLTVKGSGVANLTGGLSICSGGGTGYVNLEQGGTINTPTVTTFDGSRPSTFTFDGGVLRANGSSPVLSSFMSGLTTAGIKEGGARIDSNGKTLAVAQNLSGYSLNGLLRHRWSFNGSLADSVGGQTATAVGAVTSGGQQYTLAGNGDYGSSYIDLGANILPSDGTTPVTIELWATENAYQTWARIFDFGFGQQNYLIMAWYCNDGSGQFPSWVEAMCGGSNVAANEKPRTYELNKEYHIAYQLIPGAGTGGVVLVKWYVFDGTTLVKSGSMNAASNFSLAGFPQTNMWLGHSEYTADKDGNASYNEVRIWNAALTEEQLRDNSLRGPDSVLHDGGLTKLGDGTLVLSGANVYSGPTTVSNGVLRVGAANAVPASNDVRVAGGTYDLGGFTVTNGVVTLESGSLLDGTLVASQFNLADSGTVYATLAGGGTLTKSGTGTVSLAGASTYTGETLIEGGTLATALPASALLRHRWSFNGNLSDSVAGQTATAVGSVNASGTQYTLAGNGAKGSSYIDLGANILPSDATTPVTIELWATQHAVQSWSRIFDFGCNTANYIIMCWTFGTDLNHDHVELQTGGVVNAQQYTMSPYTLDTEFHISMVLTPGAGTGGKMLAQWYKMDASGNTLKSGSMSLDFSLANLTQSNMWLGHSEWPDNDANASYNEVRIWNAALTEAQLQANSVLGPDALQSTFSSGAALPSNARVTLAAGAALNLAGTTQTVSSVSGSGTVSNGTLNVTDTIAPGGEGVIGTLTLAAETSLAGTLLVDVAADGSSDLLQSPGALNLSGLALTVQNPDQLTKGQEYTIVQAAPGTLSGRFASTSIDTGKWQVIYRYATGEVKIILRQGLTVIVR